MALVAVLGLSLASCSDQGGKYGASMSSIGKEKKVDVSDIIHSHEVCMKEPSKSFDTVDKLYEDFNDLQEDDLFCFQSDADYLVVMPELDKSDNEDARAMVDWYNAGVTISNVLSDLEMVWRELVKPEDEKEAFARYDMSHYYSKRVQGIMQTMQSDVKKLMAEEEENNEWAVDDSLTNAIFSAVEKLNSIIPVEMEESLVLDIIDEVDSAGVLLVEEKLEKMWAKEMDDDKRVDLFLRAIQNASSFDEQCELLCGWADNEKSTAAQDDWIAVVALRLLTADKYSICLDRVWGIFRCLYQYEYCGLSKDSNIPNEAYNVLRRRAFVTCLRHVMDCPDDDYARIMLVQFAGEDNLKRFGEYEFGNQVVEEQIKYMYERVRHIFEGSHSEDESGDFDDEENEE